MGTILVWATAWAFIAVIARLVARPDRGAALGGRRLRAELDALYGGEHEYARVSPAAFPDADMAWYDRATAEFEAKGWKRLADIEDLTVSRVYPDRRTFLRVFVDGGGITRAAIYHIRVRGPGSLWQMVSSAQRDLHLIEVVSEVARGRFLSTSNTRALDKLSVPKDYDVERLEQGTALAAVIARHHARLAEHIKRRGADAPAPQWSWEDVLASIQRGHIVIAKHRQAVGGLSRDEVERFTGRPLNPIEEVFLREVRGETEPAAEAAPVEVKPTPDKPDGEPT
jgi:hypothetical protein